MAVSRLARLEQGAEVGGEPSGENKDEIGKKFCHKTIWGRVKMRFETSIAMENIWNEGG